jgi:peptide/nickel transport system permease protein
MKKRFKWSFLIGATVLALFIAIAVLSLIWTPYSIDDSSGERLAPPSSAHLFGTDTLGRDLLTRAMIGCRIAMQVGLLATLIGGLLGISLGIASGFARKYLDGLAASTLDIVIAFPTLLIAMLLVASMGASLQSAILAISLGIAASLARITRTLTKRVVALDFITAAQISGGSTFSIAFKHVLPNIWPAILANLSLQFGLAGLAEASLSYLGLGAPPPHASLGNLLQESQETAFIAPAGAIVPGILLIALVLSMNFVADGVRDRLDPLLARKS